MRVNKPFRKSNPNNCPLIEVDEDGCEVGTCWFYMEDGKTCPRHGDITPYLKRQGEEGYGHTRNAQPGNEESR